MGEGCRLERFVTGSLLNGQLKEEIKPAKSQVSSKLENCSCGDWIFVLKVGSGLRV
jgi:hypothetical protein